MKRWQIDILTFVMLTPLIYFNYYHRNIITAFFVGIFLTYGVIAFLKDINKVFFT